ncbi:hypothetical protein [Lysinibacillus piscis]|uniref:Secreted protein n=1 Tax=Lysinibacillus piscis TaxID=2518931 RepID=A0ABQ5NQE5_9BACI|nr:hypothetical protein [Lysinibacillus sp. KH24]GLC90538.1 hypothetical protein LYSBPC_36650 [Lysinibacillus sp. KH24]
MKKQLIAGTMAVGLLLTGASPSLANTSVAPVSPIDLSSMDLETALMMVQQQRANLLESQLKGQVDAIQARNAQVAELNTQLGALQVAKSQAQANKDEKKVTELDTQIQMLKSQIDAINSSQQMDMLRMQSLTNKRNEAFEVMTNFIKKMSDSRSSILGNMR